jgi:RNA polymerase sigma factor (sigma-70 family)
MDGSDVSETLIAALDGDQAAWRRLVEAHNGLLWWIARSYGLDTDAAADLVQTMWLAVLKHGRSIQHPERFTAWLSTAARREALLRSKSRNRTIPRAEFDDRSDDTATVAGESLMDAEDLGAALAAFRQLDHGCQTLLRLVCAVPALSYTEVAARIGKTPGYIGPTRARCLERLRALMWPPHDMVPSNA